MGWGSAEAFFALTAVAGLQLVLTAVPTVYRALQIVGAAYLLFIAYKLWITAPKPLNLSDDPGIDQGSIVRAFLLGLGTQLSNPKTAIVYASVFTATLPEQASSTIAVALVALIFLIEFGWYAFVAIAFSTGSARDVYVGGKTWLDRFAASAMGALGVKILADVRPT